METDTIATFLPPEKSVGKFFIDLGIDQLVYGNVDGIFCLDWRYFDRTELDQIVKKRAFTSEVTDELVLYTRTKDGRRSHPSISNDSEVEYCFHSVRFSRIEKQFFLFVEVKKDEERLYMYEQTVPFFRRLLKLDNMDVDKQRPSRASRSSLNKARIFSGP